MHISYSNIHPKGATLINSDGNILKRIPLNGQPGDIIYYDAPHSNYLSQELFKPDINSNISEIEIIMNRHDNTGYNLMGLHFDLKLEITELVEPTLLTEIESHMRRDKERFFKKDGGWVIFIWQIRDYANRFPMKLRTSDRRTPSIFMDSNSKNIYIFDEIFVKKK